MAWPFSPGEILTAANLHAAIPRPNNAVCQVSTATGNTLTNGSVATISWEIEQLDPSGWFAPGSPTLITPLIAGWYRVSVRGHAGDDVDDDATRLYVAVQANSVDVAVFNFESSSGGVNQMFGTTHLIAMNGSTDNFRIQALQANADGDAHTFSGHFMVELVHWT